MNWHKWFKDNAVASWNSMNLEHMYQAFKARMMEEQKDAKDKPVAQNTQRMFTREDLISLLGFNSCFDECSERLSYAETVSKWLVRMKYK